MTADPTWDCAALSKAVCDILVEQGKIKVKPEFIRNDREKKITGIFEAAKLDGVAMNAKNGREVEVCVRNATQGEAWVDDVQKTLRSMLSEEQAAKTDVQESEEVKKVREKVLESASAAGPDLPPSPEQRGGRGDASFSNFGGRKGGGDRACYNCGEEGHMSKDCPNPRSGSFGGGSFGGDRNSSAECYNCGKIGHLSRDCPEPRAGSFGGGGRGGGGGACYNCGQEGHLSRDCPEPRAGGGGGGGGDRACYNCGQVGHVSRDCPEPRKDRY